MTKIHTSLGIKGALGQFITNWYVSNGHMRSLETRNVSAKSAFEINSNRESFGAAPDMNAFRNGAEISAANRKHASGYPAAPW
jgi:hypothetical protein